MLNARIRKRWLRAGARSGAVGAPADLTYGVQHLGRRAARCWASLGEFSQVLQTAKRPMIIVGQGALRRADGAAVLAAAWALADGVGAITADWHGFNVLHTAAVAGRRARSRLRAGAGRQEPRRR